MGLMGFAKALWKRRACIVGATLIIVAMFFIFQYYQWYTTHAAMQGYWRILGKTSTQFYMLIDEHDLRIIDVGGPKVVYENDKFKFKYKSVLATRSHRLELKTAFPKDGKLSAVDPMFDGRKLHAQVYPVIGTMHISDKEGNQLRLVKDNQYTLDHLSL